jgi:hypothetical protein
VKKAEREAFDLLLLAFDHFLTAVGSGNATGGARPFVTPIEACARDARELIAMAKKVLNGG